MSVVFDMTGLKNLQKMKTGGVHTRNAMGAIGTLYLSAIRKRYNKLSRGGGGWQQLEPATVKAKGGSTVILKDTGLLFNALSPGAKGSLKKLKGNKAIRVGFANVQHNDGDDVTFQTLANWHDQGEGDLPERQIFVTDLDRGTVGRMRSVLKELIEKQAEG